MSEWIERLRPTPSRRPELDGLRGIAILLVLWAHLLDGVGPHNRPFLAGVPGLLPGGGLTGVQLFFVLSGYLITSILVKDFADRGARAFGRFYLRRARRLLPALVVLCAAYAAFVLVMHHGEQRRLGLGSVWASLTYTSNLPLFDNDGWIGHTWSLAVEEQFYLVWPLLLFGALRLGGKHLAVGLTIVAIVTTAVLRHALHVSPDTGWMLFRWDALMIGAFVALVPMRGHWLVGLLGFGVLVYYSVTKITFHPDVYIAVEVAAVAVLVSAASHRWLQNSVLQYLGLISYGLYLWHLLVMRFGWSGPVSLGLSLVIATISYLAIELPIMRWRSRTATSRS